MSTKTNPPIDASQELIDAIRAFPFEREVDHCNTKFTVSPFDFYAECPDCGKRIKLRSFSGSVEIEDVFDAVFEWQNDPLARKVAVRRQAEIAEEESEA